MLLWQRHCGVSYYSLCSICVSRCCAAPSRAIFFPCKLVSCLLQMALRATSFFIISWLPISFHSLHCMQAHQYCVLLVFDRFFRLLYPHLMNRHRWLAPHHVRWAAGDFFLYALKIICYKCSQLVWKNEHFFSHIEHRKNRKRLYLANTRYHRNSN